MDRWTEADHDHEMPRSPERLRDQDDGWDVPPTSHEPPKPDQSPDSPGDSQTDPRDERLATELGRSALQHQVDRHEDFQRFEPEQAEERGDGGQPTDEQVSVNDRQEIADPVPSARSWEQRDHRLEQLATIDVSNIDFEDNPVLGVGGKGGASDQDYEWAVETWSVLIEPALQNGERREDFELLDAARDEPEFRKTAKVYDLFVGDDRIVLSPRPDGTYDVINGRHRVEAARRLGITVLPAWIPKV